MELAWMLLLGESTSPQDQNTPLHLAALNGKTEAVAALIEAIPGPDIEAENKV